MSTLHRRRHPSPSPTATTPRLLFADDNTLWIGSQFCATGERAKLKPELQLPHQLNLGSGPHPSFPPSTRRTPNSRVPLPQRQPEPVLLGDLTGLCWVENLHKVYTAYGGQVHAFNTTDRSEINNHSSSSRAQPSTSPTWTPAPTQPTNAGRGKRD